MRAGNIRYVGGCASEGWHARPQREVRTNTKASEPSLPLRRAWRVEIKVKTDVKAGQPWLPPGKGLGLRNLWKQVGPPPWRPWKELW